MPCHAMHPIQDLFLESFSYALQFDMHSYVDKNLILVKSGCYSCPATPWLPYKRVAKGSLLHLTSSQATSNFLNPSPCLS
jgi:hypothetical protein